MKNTKLSDFISQSLIEVLDGISIAQKHAQEVNAKINPKNIRKDSNESFFYISDVRASDGKKTLVTPIDFDIAVTSSEGDEAKGGVGIFAASLGLGVQGETSRLTENYSRIKFQVMVQFPNQKN